MKALSAAALLVSVGAAAMAGYSFQKIDQAQRQVEELAQGIGSLAYTTIDPRLNVTIEDMGIDFGSYSNKLHGKIKVKVTNEKFPLDKFRTALTILIKDSRGKTVLKNDLYHEIEGDSIVFEFKDEYLSDSDQLRKLERYDFEVVSYSWGPVEKVFKTVN